MRKPYSVEHTSRSVIEQKLLTALEDKNTVACLFSKQDLEDIIAALDGYVIGDTGKPLPSNTLSWDQHMARRKDISGGLKQLLNQAFPLV